MLQGKFSFQVARSTAFVSAVVSASVLLQPGPARAQSLRETLELTHTTNPVLRAQRAGLEATSELLPQARAGLLPKVNAQAGVTQVLSSTFETPPQDAGQGSSDTADPAAQIFGAFAGNGSDQTTSAAVEAQQPLFQGFRNINNIREARSRISEAQADLIATEQQILAEAAAAYFSVVTNEQSVRASEGTLRALDGQLKAAQARFEAGQGTRTDTAQAQARYAGAEADLIRARSDLAAARKQYERIVGQMPMTLEAEPTLPALPDSMDMALQTALSNNPQLLAAFARLEAAGYNLKSARGLLAPTVTANARYQYAEGQFIEGDTSENSSIGAQINIPIFQGGQTYSAIRQARAGEKAERFSLDATRRSVTEQTQVAWERVVSARAAFEASQQTVVANEVALRGLELENRVGQRTTLDVLNGQQELLAARLGSYQARERYQLAVFALMQAMGTLDVQALNISSSGE
ncbi:TolC family outer membrane protein [Parvularcula sp. IMCC14364]|uniref:TolC family outer membrane protein n=1 Tax=Parvularcula sp. IMCC14364 TaxID=3067902 RepID=UPI002740C2A0|nr:TolC family outer membrane protein [Parvularcula sp. IMCC14364]